jgi:hypothetical protein
MATTSGTEPTGHFPKNNECVAGIQKEDGDNNPIDRVESHKLQF